jgi:hypothetical protein
MSEWEDTLERQERRTEKKWARAHVVGTSHDVAYTYDARTGHAHPVDRPRRYVSAEHAIQTFLKTHAACATARGMNPESMLMRVQGGGSSEPRYDDMIDLKRAFLSAYRFVLSRGRRRGERDAGLAKWLVWCDVAVEKRGEEIGLRYARTEHNRRVLHEGLQASVVKSHKTMKRWADEVSRVCEVELVAHGMWVHGAVDREEI